MDRFLQDVRFAFRMLVKRPGFTAVAVVALALGIGANTAIFSVVNAVLLRPLPYPEAERLVWIWETNPTVGILEETASPPNFADWRGQSQSFEGMTAFTNLGLNLSGDGEPERIPGYGVTPDFFFVMGIQPKLGRAFAADEDKTGQNRVVVISHRLWQRRFGSDPNVAGTSVTINGSPYTVIGVMPEDFQQPVPEDRSAAEIWMPYLINPQANRRGDFLSVVARLKPGVSLDQARAEMSTITNGLAQQYPNTNTNWGVKILPLHERFVGNIRPALLVILGAVCFLLLIACANIANLLLARSASRQKEIAIRTALGAGRTRLVRQLLTESVLLALMGAAVGLLLAFWGIEALTALGPSNVPRLQEIGVDMNVLGFTLGVAVVTGLIFGLFPALHISGLNLNDVLKEGGRNAAEGGRGSRMRSMLAAAEIALALVLLIGAGLMIRSFLRLQDVDPGFNTERILTMDFILPRAKYGDMPRRLSFHQQLLSGVQSLPGVESAGTGDVMPVGDGGNYLSFEIEEPRESGPDDLQDANVTIVSPDYFRALQIPLLQGRLFTERDNQEAPEEVAIINETMARRFWPDEDPVGKRITFRNPAQGRWMRVVGVVRDVRNKGLASEPYPQCYWAYEQGPPSGMVLFVRTGGDPMGMVSAVRSRVREIDPDMPLYNVRSMEQSLSESVAQPRFNMTLIAIFAGVALLLAAVGIYGVISYSVTQRTQEIGIRMALGARQNDVMKMVVGHGLKVAIIGVACGLPAAFLLTRLMESLLFGVGATDPLTFGSLSLLLVSVALLASYIPARRAMKVDPMEALRQQ